MLTDAQIFWLRDHLSVDFIKESWIFGSSVSGADIVNDIDIYIKYLDGHSSKIVVLRGKLEVDFNTVFGESLHFLVLNESESDEASDFLGKALKPGVRIL